MDGSTGAVAVATYNSAGGGGVTTWAISTSSPVGWMALIGACLSCTTTGASDVLIGSATSTGISAGVKGTGVFLALASSIALIFGWTNPSPEFPAG